MVYHYCSTTCKFFCCIDDKNSETLNWCVINDPLGQTHSLASSEHCFVLNLFCFEKWGRTDADVRTDDMCTKTMIPTGLDCGLAEWINWTGGNQSTTQMLYFSTATALQILASHVQEKSQQFPIWAKIFCHVYLSISYFTVCISLAHSTDFPYVKCNYIWHMDFNFCLP